MIWARLGILEWSRSVTGLSRDRTGRLDFFFLTILLALTLTLGMLLLGTREGILNRFIDTSLGRLQGHGIPIWVYTTIIDRSGRMDSLIDSRELIDELDATIGARIYVYREIEPNRVSLPGYDDARAFYEEEVMAPIPVWGEDGVQMPFNVRGVSNQDPLWLRAGVPSDPSESMPLVIVLNRSLFKRHFQCAVYLEALASAQFRSPLPPRDLAEVSKQKSSAGLGCLDNGILWLQVKTGVRYLELVPFKIVWRDTRIETMEEVAALFPLATFNAIQAAARLPALRYFPEGYGSVVSRISQLRIWPGAQSSVTENRVKKFRDCLGRRVTRQGWLLILKPAVSASHVLGCGKSADLAVKQGGEAPLVRPFLSVSRSERSHGLTTVNDHELLIPCDGLGKKGRERFGCQREDVDGAGGEKAVKVGLSLLDGYQFAQIYVEDRDDVMRIVSMMRAETRGLLTLRPEYENALKRFMFINDVVNLLRGAFLPVFGLFLLILLIVQLGMVFTHRRHNYGVLLAVGLRPGAVLSMVLLQVSASFFTAFTVATLAISGMRALLSKHFLKVLDAGGYADYLDIGEPDLLPVSQVDFLMLGGTAALVTALVTVLLLMRLLAPWPFGRIPEPAKMLYS
ncbi:MAG: hypothetical protein GY703_02030 [Gammaproteobacteria bacterium]|nr:hypothetical protein [Gammaproteobacteria bacterium]